MDERDHVDAADCWCKPYLYWTTETGHEIWIHRSEDGSEPPLAMLLEVMEAAELGVYLDTVQAG